MTANAQLFADEATYKDNTRLGDFLRMFLSEDKVNWISRWIHNLFMCMCFLIVMFTAAGWLRKGLDYIMR